MPSRSVEKEQFWRMVLEEHKKSGLTAREFCRNESISEPSFYSWRRKLRNRDADSATRLVPVEVVKDETPRRDRVSAASDDSIEVISRDQIVVRVCESSSVDTIFRVLTAVRRLDKPTC